MPRLSVLIVRTALVVLAAGAALGALLLSAPALGAPGLLRWRPLHAELLLVGWMVQLTFGVAFWILPRFRSGRDRGRVELAWAAYGLINVGALLAGVAGSLGAAGWTLAGRGAEALAAGAFAAHAWPRVKPFR